MEVKRICEVISTIRDYVSYTIKYSDGVLEEEFELTKNREDG